MPKLHTSDEQTLREEELYEKNKRRARRRILEKRQRHREKLRCRYSHLSSSGIFRCEMEQYNTMCDRHMALKKAGR